MATTTLKVPAEHVEAWQDAVLVELRTDARALIENVEDAQRAALTDRARIEEARIRRIETDPPKPLVLDDVLWPETSLRQDFEILRGSFAGPDDLLEVTGETGALAHICETMANKIVPSKPRSTVPSAPELKMTS